MKVRELLENGIAGEEVKQYSAVNIGYTDRNGLEQETQLNVAHRLDTEEGKKELEELLVEKENQVTKLVEMIRRELEEKNARIRQLEEELEAEHKKNELLRSIQERLQKIEQSVNGTPLKSPATEEKESGLFAWQKKK